MKQVTILLTILFIINGAHAQTGTDSVKAVVNNMFAGMKNGDASLFSSTFAENAILQTITKNKEGRTIVRSEDVAGFAAFVGKLKKDSADERIQFDAIKIDGPLAIVWTPYRFYHNGQFSHCGVNSFHLVRFEGAWKIQYLIDTRRKDACLF